MPAFTAARLLTPREIVERPWVLVDQGHITEIASRDVRPLPAGTSPVDLGHHVVAPGYVDLHIHGGAGYDVMDDTPEALPAIERLLALHGVTSYFPTTVTAPLDLTLRALERLASAIEAREQAGDRMRRPNRHMAKVRVLERNRSGFTWKDPSSAMLAAVFILPRMCCLPSLKLSTAFGRPRAGTFV